MQKAWLFPVTVYIVLVIIFGKSLLSALAQVPVISVFIAFLFILISLMLEFVKFEYYLRILNINLSVSKGLLIFMSGNAYAFMPAKTGELTRSALLKKLGFSYRRTIPLYFVMNFTLFIIMLALSLPVLLVLDQHLLFYLCMAGLIIFAFSVRYTQIYENILAGINIRLKLKFIKNIRQSLIHSKKLLGVKELAIALILTIIYAFFVFLAFYTLSKHFTGDILLVYSIYNLSLIIGILSMLPGGIGMTEGSYIAILSTVMEPGLAAAIILVMRFISLWIPMLLGMMSLFIFGHSHIRRCGNKAGGS